MPDNSFCRVRVKGLPRKQEEIFTSFCFEHGAQGVFEDLAYAQPELVYEPTVVETDACDLNVFFAERPSEEFFLQLKGQFPKATATAETEENKDWLEEWKKGFKPFVFIEPFWIVPSWCEPPPEAKQVLWMEPGMAFGTGTHETTQLAAQLVVEVAGARKPASALDVGTGTGVLAIVAERLGATTVVAIDNDPEARRVARENLVPNKTARVEVPDKNIEDIDAKFDLVIANIIDGILLDLKPELLRVLKPGGSLVLSGVLAEREDLFTGRFLEGSGLRITRRLQKNEWVGLLLQ